MFRRRRRPAGVVVFDVGADDEPATLLTEGEPADDEPVPPPARRTPAQARRQLVVALAALVAVLAAGAVTAAVHEHQRVERLRTAPGGVLSLAHPPAVQWTLDTDDADRPLFLPGLVVLRQGTQLVAYGVEAADERWRVEVGGDPTCGVVGWLGASAWYRSDDPLVCWSGPNADRWTVTVVDAAGHATTRDVPAGWTAVAPGPDGSLVLGRRDGPELPAPDVTFTGDNTNGWEVTGSIDRGRDTTVRLEDAATGAVRWERTVAFEPPGENVWNCATFTWDDTTGGATAEVRVDDLAVVATPGTVRVQGCGIAGTFTAGGAAVADLARNARTEVTDYADGGTLESVGGYAEDGVVSVLYGAAGAVAGTFAAPLLNPWATDGTGTDVRLTGNAGVALTRRGLDDRQLWTSGRPVTDLLVRAGDVAVVAGPDGDLAGIDLRTGAVRWSGEDLLGVGVPDGISGADGRFGAAHLVDEAFTDGVVAMVETYDWDAGTGRRIAFDLATGERAWEVPHDDADARYVAVDGRLFELTGGATAYYDDAGGETVRRTLGTLSLLG
jgi:hypothetical protein